MTILVEISSEAEVNLAAQAVARGIALEQYASKLLEDAAISRPTGKGRLTRESLDAMLSRIGEGAEYRPKLPTSAFSRESFYEDRT
jgi:hypothetical protein